VRLKATIYVDYFEMIVENLFFIRRLAFTVKIAV